MVACGPPSRRILREPLRWTPSWLARGGGLPTVAHAVTWRSTYAASQLRWTTFAGIVSEGWAHQDSNLERAGYEPAALTVELWARKSLTVVPVLSAEGLGIVPGFAVLSAQCLGIVLSAPT